MYVGCMGCIRPVHPFFFFVGGYAMKHINRLLMQARTAKNGKGMHVLGFVDYSEEKRCYTAKGTIWDGVFGSGGESFYSEHETEEEALAACEAVAARYPNCENLNFITERI